MHFLREGRGTVAAVAALMISQPLRDTRAPMPRSRFTLNYPPPIQRRHDGRKRGQNKEGTLALCRVIRESRFSSKPMPAKYKNWSTFSGQTSVATLPRQNIPQSFKNKSKCSSWYAKILLFCLTNSF